MCTFTRREELKGHPRATSTKPTLSLHADRSHSIIKSHWPSGTFFSVAIGMAWSRRCAWLHTRPQRAGTSCSLPVVSPHPHANPSVSPHPPTPTHPSIPPISPHPATHPWHSPRLPTTPRPRTQTHILPLFFCRLDYPTPCHVPPSHSPHIFPDRSYGYISGRWGFTSSCDLHPHDQTAFLPLICQFLINHIVSRGSASARGMTKPERSCWLDARKPN